MHGNCFAKMHSFLSVFSLFPTGLLTVCAYVLRFLEWWYASDSLALHSAVTLPSPPPPLHLVVCCPGQSRLLCAYNYFCSNYRFPLMAIEHCVQFARNLTRILLLWLHQGLFSAILVYWIVFTTVTIVP